MINKTDTFQKKLQILRDKYIQINEKNPLETEIHDAILQIITVIKIESQKIKVNKKTDLKFQQKIRELKEKSDPKINVDFDGRIDQLQKEIYLPLINSYTRGIGKYKEILGQQYWSENAITNYMDNDVKLEHEHVYEVINFSKDLIHNKDVHELSPNFISCVVTKKEHEELSNLKKGLNKEKKDDLEGWKRYQAASIIVYDLETGLEFKFPEKHD